MDAPFSKFLKEESRSPKGSSSSDCPKLTVPTSLDYQLQNVLDNIDLSKVFPIICNGMHQLLQSGFLDRSYSVDGMERMVRAGFVLLNTMEYTAKNIMLQASGGGGNEAGMSGVLSAVLEAVGRTHYLSVALSVVAASIKNNAFIYAPIKNDSRLRRLYGVTAGEAQSFSGHRPYQHFDLFESMSKLLDCLQCVCKDLQSSKNEMEQERSKEISKVIILGALTIHFMAFTSKSSRYLKNLIYTEDPNEISRKMVIASQGLSLRFEIPPLDFEKEKIDNKPKKQVRYKLVDMKSHTKGMVKDLDLQEGGGVCSFEERDLMLANVKLSIDSLSTNLRDSLFDIIAFFNHQKWWFVAYAVGEEAIEELKSCHLIHEHTVDMDMKMDEIYHINEITTSFTETFVKVHDIVHDLGQKMMEERGEVIKSSDMHGLEEEVIQGSNELQYLESFDSKKLKNIRRICLGKGKKTKPLIPWSLLSQMQNIRVLNGVLVEDHQFIKPLKSLKVFYLDGHCSDKPFSLENAPNLNILRGTSINMVPEGLKYLRLHDCLSLPSFRNCQLQYLKLSKCDNLVQLEGIQHLFSLKHLIISRCNKLREVEGLSCLQSLEIRSCSGIEQLKSCNFSDLCSLRLHNCPCLKIIPFDFKSLRYLRIDGCPRLQRIPDVLEFKSIAYFFFEDTSVKQLPLPLHVIWTNEISYQSLRHISLSGSESLEELARLFFRFYRNLQTLDLSYCSKLISLPNKDNYGHTNFELRILSLKNCVSLETLDVSYLSRLEELDVSSSDKLKNCCISESQPIELLDFSHCEKLESLEKTPILLLKRLKKLNLEGCWRIRTEVEAILLWIMPHSIEEINVRGCLNMEEVEKCIPDKRMDVKVISRCSFWSEEMSEEEMMAKMSEVLQCLHFLDSMNNIIPGTQL